MLVVYVTHGSERPVRTLQQVRDYIFGAAGSSPAGFPSMADVFAFSSWGYTTMPPSTVDFWEMESTTTTTGWTSLGQTRDGVINSPPTRRASPRVRMIES